MKIYTKTGDEGSTGLFNGQRVMKSDIRVDAYGTIDELNSIIGLAIAFDLPDEMTEDIRAVSKDLFFLGTDLATPLNPPPKFIVHRLSVDKIIRLEKLIDCYTERLPKLTNFILPGGTKSASFLHQARTVCRRAERLVVELQSKEEVNNDAVIYLNRLSDYLFTAARMANYLDNMPDIVWKSK